MMLLPLGLASLAGAAGGEIPQRTEGRGWVLDSSHPKRPGDATRYDIAAAIAFDPDRLESVIEVTSGAPGKETVDRWFTRRGRIFQVDATGAEQPAEALGDLDAATVAALHPGLLDHAMRGRPEETLPLGQLAGTMLASNDVLWNVRVVGSTTLRRRILHEQYGNGEEVVEYALATGSDDSTRVTVTRFGREVAHFAFGPLHDAPAPAIPAGDRRRDRGHSVRDEEIVLQPVAPGFHVIALDSLNTRMFVVEFADSVVVLEGAYNSAVCDRVARIVRERLGKPIAGFAFSHLHGQYIGGVRSFVDAGATVIVPPTTAPLVERIVRAEFLARDALSGSRRPLRLRTVADRLERSDATNTLVIFNNAASAHTDEYLNFWLPRQKILLSGDLFFYRPGKPATGRSRDFCATIAKLGLDFETLWCTWPLAGYGTKSVVTRAEFDSACAATP